MQDLTCTAPARKLTGQSGSYKYKGCIPITVYCVQVRVDKMFTCEYVNVKEFESYSRAKELLNYLND